MAGSAIKVSLAELASNLGHAAQVMESPAAMLDDIGFEVQESTVRRFSEGKSPKGVPWKQKSDGSPSTLEQTGHLAASIQNVVVGNVIHVGSGKVYARIHQEGGEIKAKDAKFLHIPLNELARREGPRRLYERGMYQRAGKEKGVAVLDIDGDIIPMFALVKQVTIPKRPYLGLSEEDKDIVRDIVADYAGQALRGQ